MDYTNSPVIYEIRNVHTGGFYVGSTVHLKTRWATHRRKLRAGTHHCPHLQASWDKHGEGVFTFTVVQLAASAEELLTVEQQWLDTFHGTEKCYNYARYVDSSARGVKFQPSHRQAISDALRAHYEKNGTRSGWNHTDETKAQISAKKLGVAKTDAHKEKLRQANVGKRASDETRALLSQQRKGVVKSSDWVAKYHKQVVERTSGVVYPSLKSAKVAYGMSPGAMNRALNSGSPIKKGRNKGLWFEYVVT